MADNFAVVLLEGAKNAIEYYGWVKGSEGNTSTGFCATGGLQYASPEPGGNDTVSARNYLDRVAKVRGHHSIISYNDAPSTTKLDVLTAYDEAIKLAKADV